MVGRVPGALQASTLLAAWTVIAAVAAIQYL